MTRKVYPSDVSDDEWAFVVPYVTLMREDAPQRGHLLREVFSGLRYIVHTGAQWRFMAHDQSPWYAVHQQTQRWMKAGVFEDMVGDLRMLMREINDPMPQPTAVNWSDGETQRGFFRCRNSASPHVSSPNFSCAPRYCRRRSPDRRRCRTRHALQPRLPTRSGYGRYRNHRRWHRRRPTA
jgi:transposase